MQYTGGLVHKVLKGEAGAVAIGYIPKERGRQRASQLENYLWRGVRRPIVCVQMGVLKGRLLSTAMLRDRR